MHRARLRRSRFALVPNSGRADWSRRTTPRRSGFALVPNSGRADFNLGYVDFVGRFALVPNSGRADLLPSMCQPLEALPWFQTRGEQTCQGVRLLDGHALPWFQTRGEQTGRLDLVDPESLLPSLLAICTKKLLTKTGFVRASPPEALQPQVGHG